MGRLISSVGAALGLTPSEHVTLEKEQTNKSLQPKAENQNAIVEDCTSCKIVGSTVMSGCGIYCMVTAWRNPKQLSGSTLRYLRVAGFAMGTCFIVLAGCRFFNLGPFSHLKSSPSSQH